MSFPRRAFQLVVVLAWVTMASSLLKEFKNEQLFTGLDEPMQLLVLPDNRMLCLNRKGIVLLIDPDSLAKKTYLSIPNVKTSGEKGLLSGILDYDFSYNGRPYVYFYFADKNTQRFEIARYEHVQGNGGQSSFARASSKFVVWRSADTYMFGNRDLLNHWGGAMAFDNQNMLLLATGDNTQPNWVEDLEKDTGKVLRVNPRTGSAPADNWARSKSTSNKFVHALGIRNGFRGFWDPATSRFLVAEVGGNIQKTAMEDLHVIKKGVHHGWPKCEGPCNNKKFSQCSCNQHDNPYWYKDHEGKNSALIGGFIYRGGNFPQEYNGAYFYGDYPRQEMRALIMKNGGTQVIEDRKFDDFTNNKGTTSLIQGKDVSANVT